MAADPVAAPVPRTPFSPTALVAFAVAVLLHAVFLWWLLGARFGHDVPPPDEPLYVVVIADDIDDAGAAPADASTATTQSLDSESRAADTVPSSRPDSTPISTPITRESVNNESGVDEDATIAVDKSVDNPVQKAVENPPVPKQVPVKNATVTPTPTPVQPPANSQTRSVSPTATKTPAPRSADQSSAKSPSSGESGPSGASTASAATTTVSSGPTGVGSSTGPRRIVRPDYLDGPPSPVYPQSARSRRQQGKVIVRVLINTTGQPTSIHVLQTSGFDVLDRAALDAVGRVHFRPYAENGVALEAQVDIPFDFVLRN